MATKKSSLARLVAGLSALCAGTVLVATSPALAQTAITAGGDGTGVSFDAATQTYTINGGTQIDANLFHSFQRFGLNTSEIANFLAQPNVMNILARVTGGEASVIDGLLRVSGGDNANLFILNPAGVLLGRNARLDLAGSFSVSSASGMAFGDEVLSATGANNYSALTGNPTGYIFLGQEGVVLNEADLAVAPGQGLTLAGSTVVNTGTLSAPGGTISIAAVPDGLLQISQEGLLIRLAVPTEQVQALAAGDGMTALDLPSLLAGEWGGRATTVTTTADGSVVLASGAAVATAPGGVTLAGDVQATGGQVGLTADRVVVASEIGTAKGVGSGAAAMAVTLNLGDEATAGRLEILPTGFLRVEELTLASPTGIAIDNARADGLHGTTLNLRSALELENYGFNPSTVVNVAAGGSVQTGVYAVDAGGTVNLAAGTYTEGSTILIDRALTLNGQGSDQTILSGNNAYQVLAINGGVTGTVNIDNLTVSGGRNAFQGGGIQNSSNATLALNNSTVSDNTAQYGGGISSNGAVTINNSIVSDNIAGYYGGGIYSNGAVTINNSIVSDNIAGYYGGGIFSWNSTTVNNSTVSGNTAQFYDGGGIFSWNSTTLNNSTVSSNTAQRGGGIVEWNNGAVKLNNSTVSNNIAQQNGGGIHSNGNGAVTLNNSTIAFNTSQNQGGGGLTVSGNNTHTFNNSIIANNTSQFGPDVYVEYGSPTFNVSHSLIGSTDGMTGTGVPTNGVDGNLVGVDPLLGPLQNNGGPTQTHALLPGSPAINAGDPAYAGPLTTDQRGAARVQGGRIDIGAFEVQPPPVEPPMVEPPVVEPPSVEPTAAQPPAAATVGFSDWPLNRMPSFAADRVAGNLRFSLSPELAQDLGLPTDEPPAVTDPSSVPAVDADASDPSDDAAPLCPPDATEDSDLDACL